MIIAGIDAGLENAKVVILRNGEVLSWLVAPTGRETIAAVADRLLTEAAAKAGIRAEEIEHVASTGIARNYVLSASEHLPEFLCLAKGIHMVSPSIRTALDLGAHKSLAVKCSNGKPLSFVTNDRCASGSGRYLETVAKILEIEIDEMANLSLKSKDVVEVQSNCAVFAESEIISLLHMKRKREDILKGVLKGVAERIYSLLLQVGWEGEVAVVGGVAKNKGIVMAIEELLACPVLVPDNPEIVGAMGSALIAEEGKRAAL